MYDKSKLLEILLNPDFCAVNNSGKPYAPSHKIYRIIAEEMAKYNSNISPKHIYVIINQNRGGCKDKMLKAFDINIHEAEVSRNASFNSVETIKKYLFPNSL